MSKGLIKRRTLIQQLGASAFLATPVFRSALSEAQGAPPLRFIVIDFPGGARQTPAGNDSDPYAIATNSFTLDKYLSGFAPLEQDLLFLDKLGDDAIPNNGHTMWGMLTGDARGYSSEVESVALPSLTSIDQAIAKGVGSGTRFSSLQFGVFTELLGEEPPDFKRCIYSSGVALQPVNDPVTLFDQLFPGGGAPGGTSTAPPTSSGPTSTYTRQKSILDLFAAELGEIKTVAGSAEQPKLDEHLTALRELEKSLPGAPGGPGMVPGVVGTTCTAPQNSGSADIVALGKSMTDLLYQSINCGLTRVASMQWLNSSGGGATTYFTHLGVGKGHHDMQHNPDADFDKVQTWLLTQIAGLVQRLKATPEGGGSLLDNCVVLVMSEMGEGSLHTNMPSPVLVAGKGGGAIRTGGRHLVCSAPLNNLYVSLGNLFGLNLSTFGDPAVCTGSVSLS